MKLAAVAAALLAAAAFAGVGLPDPARSAEAQSQDGITVTGSGSVQTVPDRAEFSFGVQSRGRTAREALAANAIEMRRVIDALKNAGIAAADIQTTQVSLSPITSGDGETITGYMAVNTVSARIRDLDASGRVIDAAVAAGANQVYGPELTRSDRNELYRQALRTAYADARAKAQALAAASGQSVGRALVIQEAGGGGPIPLADRAAGAEAQTPVEPGTQAIEAIVTVTFALS
ncbi:MAG: SIMPL domain-containing protein [Actinomycetota bacterium]|nr:SIMPL domain-containing protein [Actinomycetota bacterium]